MKFFLLIFLIGIVACQGDETDSKKGKRFNEKPAEEMPPEDNPEGYINGQKWVFRQGKALIFNQHDQEYLIINLWDQEYEKPCSESNGSNLQVRIVAKKEEGRYVVGKDVFALAPSIVFTDLKAATPLNHIVANHGAIYIEKLNTLSDQTISGAFVGQFSALTVGQTEAKGRFNVILCQSQNLVE